MDSIEEARDLLAAHGRRAQQLVVDEIVAAIRRGDDAEARRRGAVLRALEREAIGGIALLSIDRNHPGSANGRDE